MSSQSRYLSNFILICPKHLQHMNSIWKSCHSRLGQESFSLCFNVPGTALIFQTAALCSRMISQDFQTEDSSIRGMWEQVLIKHRYRRPRSAYLHVMRHTFMYNKNHTASFRAVHINSRSVWVLKCCCLCHCNLHHQDLLSVPFIPGLSCVCVCVVVFPCFFFTWIM